MATFIVGVVVLAVVGLIIRSMVKDKKNGKRLTLNNIMAGILCLVIAGIIGFICIKIPNIINFSVNIVLYLIVIIFLTYTIATSGKKPE